MLHKNLNGALYIKNDFFLFFYSFGVLLNFSIYYYYYYYFLSISFGYLPIIFPTLNMLPPYPTTLNVHRVLVQSFFFFFNFGYTLHHRIFTAILTCSTIKTLPSGSQKRKKKKMKKMKKPSSVKDDFFLSFFFFFWLKCTTTPKMALY